MNSVNSDIELFLHDICANYNDKTIVKYNEGVFRGSQIWQKFSY